MLSEAQLAEVDRIITETPVETTEILNPYDSMLSEIEVDDAFTTLQAAARRVREYLTPLNQGDGT
jgi:regulator of sigma D